MTNVTTLKAISLATVFAVTASFSSAAFAHDLPKAEENVATVGDHHRISKSNARNLVKALLKREYSGNGYKANGAKKIGDSWVVKIKDRAKTVATASIDTKTGNIHVE